jgi:myo-inositol-1(or 4)-monophosphatase
MNAWPHKLQIAEQIAREAGEILLEGWERRPVVEFKTAERDLVTEYDRRSEALIVERLRRAFPADAIVGEVGAANPAAPASDGTGSGTW